MRFEPRLVASMRIGSNTLLHVWRPVGLFLGIVLLAPLYSQESFQTRKSLSSSQRAFPTPGRPEPTFQPRATTAFCWVEGGGTARPPASCLFSPIDEAGTVDFAHSQLPGNVP